MDTRLVVERVQMFHQHLLQECLQPPLNLFDSTMLGLVQEALLHQRLLPQRHPHHHHQERSLDSVLYHQLHHPATPLLLQGLLSNYY